MVEQFPDSGRAMGGNTPEFSVAEISGAIRRVLEGTFGRIRVRGEITEFKRYPSGHLYFSLKDEGGKLSSVVWRGTVSRLGLKPENGVEVIATGKISSYGERSSYQMVIDRLEYAGEGALLARIERLRLRLAQEGLFDAERKRPLPFLPRLIGVVTSAQGAVLHDIRTTIARRFALPVLVWPVPVQGEGAAERIAQAIAGFDAIGPKSGVPRPDVLIVARGGGSLEDLMAFNDEAVLQAVAACRIPVISAVGHETDTTLIDFVSDRRAPTPTAAAEMAVPVRAELEAGLAQRAARLRSGLERGLQLARARLERAAAGLPDLPAVVENARRRLDDRAYRLDLALPARLSRLRERVQAASDRLPAPQMILALRRAELDRVGTASQQAMSRLLHRHAATLGRLRVPPAVLVAQLRASKSMLAGVAGQLDSLSPQAVLERGYVLVTDRAGRPLAQAAQARAAPEVIMTFADGTVAARPLEAPPGPQGQLDL
ncbi:exodeoxyribonuclease VII large subunit [Komagataeibacter sp. AV436]|uniref:Exodeoxyribonuclease 7 large subunit n=1 Tax=Komagataeibacter melomenusus TaxID=2766578 RepID=A0ABX2AES9_9PROT|nr:exodeoxyribonuclease VII large subunit [Komagataeibacter melomenusus]MBV1830606.1 exodeoxyribonuclease VII large subunit [Komagataeibacter melomenusus]NPC66567.1 exodeoxyribonuclease VII large subunit [Komagataeibacter melomenusus]